MSISLSIEKINKFFQSERVKLPLPAEVAVDKETSELLLRLEDYTEEKLKELVAEKDVYVNYLFWNYDYCNVNNLCNKDKTHLTKDIKTPFFDLDIVSVGVLISTISHYELLLHTYTVEEVENYEKLLRDINIDKNIVSKFLIDNNFCLPLNENFLLLIKRVFGPNNILDFIFREKECRFSCEQIKTILTEVEFDNMNEAGEHIFNNYNYSLEDKLFYIKALLEVYDGTIDTNPTIYLNEKIYKPCLGYHLFSIQVEGRITRLYYEVMGLFFAKGGVKNIIFVNNSELTDFFAERSKHIRDV
jgi:hypothetical protein